MAKIKTYARIKPSEDIYDDFESTNNKLYIRIPDSYSRDSTLYNRTRTPIVNHEFKYSQVFNQNTSQDEVYNTVAKSIINGFLDGYNGTIFAYGQTSSGKTYTMHGDSSTSTDSGLTPRGLSEIFRAVQSRRDAGENVTIHVSFLEIYQEVGYDLLKTNKQTGPVQAGFAKVTVVDGPQGSAIVKNLSLHAVNSEEAAQAILTQGEVNRKVAETAMNHRSSRSHAVFTIYLSSRKGDLLVRSKMHFVDLAGSERVCKTGVKGLQLSEAKYINLSLHYLEGVIIALQQGLGSMSRKIHPQNLAKSWSASHHRPYSAADVTGKPKHIPYRNSLLTMLLKDSLGGNCLTAMIATVSLEMNNLSESISTCRFAQRVSSISNTARKNAEIDDKSMIKRLRTRVAELEVENNILKHGGEAVEEQEFEARLTDEDKQLCQSVVQDFVTGRLMDPVVAGVTDPFKFRECMKIFKKLIIDYNNKSIRLAEKLKSQPGHVQEAYFTGGRYYEAPLAKPSKRTQIQFRDDSNTLTRNAYTADSQSKRTFSGLRPTILKNKEKTAWTKPQSQVTSRQDVPAAAHMVISAGTESFKPQSAMAAFRTPYEKKKVKEVMKLNEKVESSLVKQIEETQHLKAFKKSIKEQEYEVIESSLNQRFVTADRQVTEQRFYIDEIKKKAHDQELLEQEKLVLVQLQKRKDRIYNDLSEVRSRITDIRLQTAEENQVTNKPTTQRSFNDKFGNLVKRNGTADTEKMKSTLKQQQTLQNKIQKNIEQQRILAIDKKLEVMEMSTRQKLEEFKQKLAQSQTNHSSDNERKSQDSSPTRNRGYTAEGQIRSANRIQDAHQPANHMQPSNTMTNSKPSTDGRQRMVDDIIAKYRKDPVKETGVSSKNNEKRTEKVDRILAKYRHNKEPETVNQSESVTSPNKQRNAVTATKTRDSISRPSKAREHTAEPSTVDSGYNSPHNSNVATPDKSSRQSTRQDHSTVASRLRAQKSQTQYFSDTQQKDIESTLRSMLHHQNRSSRRAVWDDTTSTVPRAREDNKQSKDILQQKLQKFLKAKETPSRQPSRERTASHRHHNKSRNESHPSNSSNRDSKAKSAHVRSNTRDNDVETGQRKAVQSAIPSQRSEKPDYSHRMSYYQNVKKEDRSRLDRYSSRGDRKPGLAVQMALKYIEESPRNVERVRPSNPAPDDNVEPQSNDNATKDHGFVVDLKKYRRG